MNQQEKAIERIKDDYENRLNLEELHGAFVLNELLQLNFIDSNIPLVDVGCGASPHVAYRCVQAFGNAYCTIFNDWNCSILKLHAQLFGWIKDQEGFSDEIESNCFYQPGDARVKKHLIKGRSVLIHGTIPRIRIDGELDFPEKSEEAMKRALSDILNAEPHNVAILLREDYELIYPVVSNALDSLGVDFQVYDEILSADFRPCESNLYVINRV